MKYLLVLIIIALFGLTFTSNANAASVVGDANCSGNVDSVDALEVNRYVAGLPNAICTSGFTLANMDCDDYLTSTDALQILRYLSNLSTPTCYPELTTRLDMIISATKYWTNVLEIYNYPTLRLVTARVDWTISDTIYDGLGGVAPVGGCHDPWYPVSCWSIVNGESVPTWGVEWMYTVIRHEFGHLMGLHHCDFNPTLPCL